MFVLLRSIFDMRNNNLLNLNKIPSICVERVIIAIFVDARIYCLVYLDPLSVIYRSHIVSVLRIITNFIDKVLLPQFRVYCLFSRI